MTTGTFTITPDGSTTAFVASIPSGNSWAMASIKTDYDPSRDEIDIAIVSAQVSGTVITIYIWQNATGTFAPVDASVGNLEINYIIA